MEQLLLETHRQTLFHDYRLNMDINLKKDFFRQKYIDYQDILEYNTKIVPELGELRGGEKDGILNDKDSFFDYDASKWTADETLLRVFYRK